MKQEVTEIVKQIASNLLSNNMTLATAESCTGGNIAHQLTLLPGSSHWYNGGVVAYTNLVKQNLLKVDVSLISKYSEVSGEVAEAMAQGVKDALKTDYAISTTGVAGPTGATNENPIGTVWIGIATPSRNISKRFVFDDNREQNIESFTLEALKMLLKNM